MTAVRLVQWGGPVREGPAPLRSIAHALVGTPPADLDGHPVLGLRAVDVPGEGRHWCFTVQAGVCQVLFVPAESARAWQVWERCSAEVAAGGGVLPDAGLSVAGWDHPPPPVERAVVERVLAGLVDDDEAVRVPGEPDEVVATIGAVLRVLPDAVVRDRVWTTLLVDAPGPERVVTGSWPARLRDSAAGAWVERWLADRARPAAARAGWDEDTGAAVRWLASRVDEPAAVAQYRGSPSVLALVHAVVDNELVHLQLDEIRPALDRGDERVLRAENLPPLTAWVRGRTAEAIEWLCAHPAGLDGVFADAVHLILLTEHIATPALVPLRLPATREDHPDWFDTSVVLTRRRCPGQGDVANLARDLVATGTDPARIGAWLRALGLDPADPDLADLFPVALETAAAEVVREGDIGPLGERYLASAPSALLALVAEVPPLEARVAPGWLARLSGDADRRALFRAIVDRHTATSLGFYGAPSTWLLTALHTTDDPALRDVMASLAALAFPGSARPSVELAREVLAISTRSAQPAAAFAEFTARLLAEGTPAPTHQPAAERQRWHDQETRLRATIAHVEQEATTPHPAPAPPPPQPRPATVDAPAPPPPAQPAPPVKQPGMKPLAYRRTILFMIIVIVALLLLTILGLVVLVVR
ncbi:hypothetical protein ACOBQX_26830 [Actinokineospora sp. G85]|uniref:hypothetical protein n=1 Tax=Actinokineospora sp. G85 TaxID=3406626 RepID=UPI003C718EA4